MGIFGKARKAPSTRDGRMPQMDHPAGSPQYFNGVEPAGSARQDGFRAPYVRPGYPDGNPNYVPNPHPAVTTPGFDDSGQDGYTLQWGHRDQPDVGGALNFAYESYELPLVQPAGPWMVARTPFMPIGAPSMQVWQAAPPTVGGLVPGQWINQPLLNPQGPGNGFDIYS